MNSGVLLKTITYGFRLCYSCTTIKFIYSRQIWQTLLVFLQNVFSRRRFKQVSGVWVKQEGNRSCLIMTIKLTSLLSPISQIMPIMPLSHCCWSFKVPKWSKGYPSKLEKITQEFIVYILTMKCIRLTIFNMSICKIISLPSNYAYLKGS